MAKKKKISRKELLSQQDEFLTYSAKLLQYAARHKKPLAVALGVVLAVGIAVSGYQFFSAQNEKKASSRSAQLFERYETLASEKSAVEAYRAIEKDFQALISDFPRTQAARRAAVTLANIGYRAGDYDGAMALYRQNIDAFENDPAIKGLILSSLAYCQEAKKEYAGAARDFDQVVQGDRFLMKDDALLGLARVYGGMGEKEKRLAVLDRLVADHEDSIYHALAREAAAGLK